MRAESPKPSETGLSALWRAFRLRWKRRRLLLRVLRKRRQITPVTDRTAGLPPDAILLFSTMRNEIVRLPHFLKHYRDLGVTHFLIVDNASDDGTTTYLSAQPDVSLWTTPHSYRLSRFGMDWVGWLLLKFGHGHWCLTVDADELLTYPEVDTCDLRCLTARLDDQGAASFGALMIDLYPKGPLRDQPYASGGDPLDVLCWFDAGNHWSQWHPVFGNLWIQGGVRARAFFADTPRRAPTLNKVPLVKWNRRHVYVSSTHQMLPPRMHDVFGTVENPITTGALLHTKFLNIIGAKSNEELDRRQHFGNSSLYTQYHATLAANPDLWAENATRYEGWRQLVDLGLMTQANNTPPKPGRDG